MEEKLCTNVILMELLSVETGKCFVLVDYRDKLRFRL
jgi:hypothetical protein